MQMLPEKRWVYAILFVALSGGAIYLHVIDFEASNANINVLLCMPFFLIGVFLKPMTSVFNNLHNYMVEMPLFVLSVALVVLCGNINGYVWMYLNGFGNNFALYILGGMAGTCMLYTISLWLSRLPNRAIVQTLSKGSILIIGLHIVIVRRLTDLSSRSWLEDLLFSFLILFSFYVLIRVSELYFPLLIGKKSQVQTHNKDE